MTRRLNGPQDVLRKCKRALEAYRASASDDSSSFDVQLSVVLDVIKLADDLARIYGFDINLIKRKRSDDFTIYDYRKVTLSSAITEAAERRFIEADQSSKATGATLRRLWPHGLSLLQLSIEVCQLVHASRVLTQAQEFPLTVQRKSQRTRETRRADPSLAQAALTVRLPGVNVPHRALNKLPKARIEDEADAEALLDQSALKVVVEPAPTSPIARAQSGVNPESSEDDPTKKLAEEPPRASDPEKVRVLQAAPVAYIRPQDGPVAERMHRTIQDFWSVIELAALSAPDSAAAAQILVPSETGFRGKAPTPAHVCHVLALARAAISTEGESDISAPAFEDVRIPRPANHLSRIDIRNAFQRYFEVAPECLEKLVLSREVDETALESYATELFDKLKWPMDKHPQAFSIIRSKAEINDSRGKPLYLRAAKNIRDKKAKEIKEKRERCLFVIGNKDKIDQDLLDNIIKGNNVLVFSPAGSGKTLLVESIFGDIIVVYNAATDVGYYSNFFKKDITRGWNDLLDQVTSMSGRKVGVVVDECTFMTPTQLAQLDAFDQIVMVGDPCQLGFPLAAEYIGYFMSRIDAYVRRDGKVYRTKNPVLFDLMNAIGYEGRFQAANTDINLSSNTFHILTCADHVVSKAVSVVLACIDYANRGLEVIVSSQDDFLLKMVQALILDDSEIFKICHRKIGYFLLSNLQGKQCDVLIFEPSELDIYIDEPFTAAKYLTMLLGRATSTICILTPERQIAQSVEDIRPFSLMFYGCSQYEPCKRSS